MTVLSRLRGLVTGSGTLSARVARASLWSAIDLGAGNVLRLAGNLIMTRLLVPEAFGLMALVTMIHIALVNFTDLGVHQSVVRSPRGGSPDFLRVAWTVQVLRSLAIAGLVVAAAGVLALLAPSLAPHGTVYADPELPALIAVSSLTVVLKGLESSNLWLADRRLQLMRLTLVNLAGQVVGLCAMLGLALLEPTVWALLWGGMIGGAAAAALTHLVFDGPRMAVRWDRDIADELWGFGKNILGSSALAFLANNADRLILGALIDIRSFGFYVIAATWVQVFTALVEKLCWQVGMAAMSEVTRDRPAQLRAIYRRLRLGIDGVCLSSFLLCLLGGPLLIELLYRPEYAAAAIFVPLLAIMVLIRRFTMLSALLLSQGDSRALLEVTALRAVAICIVMPLGFHAFGIAGAILASAMTQLAGAPLLVRRARPVLDTDVCLDAATIGVILAIGLLLYVVYGGSVGG